MASLESNSEKNVLRDQDSLNAGQSFDEITLEYVSGVSSASKNAIALNKSNGNVAFIASSVLALFDPRFSHQAFIENSSSREIRSVTFSDDGKFLAFGENGVNPSVSVYSAKMFTHISRFQVEERKCAIKALQFHPRSIYLALLLAHDYTILVYEFIHGRKLAAARWCVEPLAMTMTKTESILAVCGHRKISCFSLSNVESTRYETNAVLDKRAVLLGKQGNYTFVDITSGHAKYAKSLYTVTACGYLCEIQTRGIFINHVVRISERCFCVGFELGMIFVGCEKGVVSLCNPSDLTVIANVSDHDMFGNDKLHPMHWDVKSDILAFVVNPRTKIVTTLMSDQKMHSWSVDLCKDAVECSPVIMSDVDNKPCPMSKVITSHDMQCTLAQLLLQLELRNNRQNEAACYLQRPSSFRNKQINAIKIAPDGKEIVVGTKEGEIKIYEATSGRLTRVIEAHSAEVTFIDMMFDDDFKLVATGGRDRLLFILDAAKAYKHVQTINDHSSAIVSISLAHNKGVLTLISSSADGVILIRRAGKEGKPVFNIVGELPEFVGCKKRVYNHSSGYIITGQERGRINVFPADPKINLKPMRKLQVGSALLKTVTIDPTGSFFIACSKEGQFVFHLQSGQQIATLCTIPGFHHLSFSQDLNYFINSNDAGCKFLWRLPSKVVDVMKAKMSTDPQNSETNTCEFFYNSYESYFRVCQQLVKQKQEPDDDKTDIFDTDAEDANSYDDGKSIVNMLDNRLRLVESESFTSCTTYSKSLTDITQGIDICADFLKPPCVKKSCSKQVVKESKSCNLDKSASPRENNSKGSVINVNESPKKSTPQTHRNNNKTDQKSPSKNCGSPDRTNTMLLGESNVQHRNLPFKTNLKLNQETMPAESSLVSFVIKSKDKSPHPTINRTTTPRPESFISELGLKCGFQSNKNGIWSFKTKDIVESDAELEECHNEIDQIKKELNAIQERGSVKNLRNKIENPKDLITTGSKRVKENGELDCENRSEKENTTVDSGIISTPSSATLKPSADSSAFKMNNSQGEFVKKYNNRYRTIQLSNSQETYVMKNVDLFTSISIINGLTSETPSGCSIDPNSQGGSRIQNISLKSPGKAEVKITRCGMFSSEKAPTCEIPLLGPMSNENAGDSELYCQDFYLKKVLLSWALKKLHKERMRRKMKSIGHEKTPSVVEDTSFSKVKPIYEISSPEISTESQPTVTSELSDISDISAYALGLSTNSTVTDSDQKNIFENETRGQGRTDTAIAEQKLINSEFAKKESLKALVCPPVKSPAPIAGGDIVSHKISTEKHSTSSEIDMEESSSCKLNTASKATQSPKTFLRGMHQVSVDVTSDQQDGEPDTSLSEQSNEVMVDLFRSQDSYLRKLKEVRQNFEKSIQALSAERESQRLEAQKHLGKPLL